jgi:hypothetical protein
MHTPALTFQLVCTRIELEITESVDARGRRLLIASSLSQPYAARHRRVQKNVRPCPVQRVAAICAGLRRHDCEGYDKREVDRASPAMVHVSPQCRQRQSALSVMNLASVSMILPLQNGHAAGRVTGPSSARDSNIIDHTASATAAGAVRSGVSLHRHAPSSHPGGTPPARRFSRCFMVLISTL